MTVHRGQRPSGTKRERTAEFQARTHLLASTKRFENRFQAQLNRSIPSSPANWIAGRLVRRCATAAEVTGRRGIVFAKAIRSAVWIREVGTVENIEEFSPELRFEPFFKWELF